MGLLLVLKVTTRRLCPCRDTRAQVDEYVESFKPTLMDVLYSWSKGAPFRDICLMTDLYEGSIIRATRRLDELMQQLAQVGLPSSQYFHGADG